MSAPDNPADLARILAGLLAGTAVTLLELTTADGAIRLVREACSAPAQPRPEPQSHPQPAPDATTVKAHAVGVFHHGHPLRPGALVQPGDSVRKGAPVGLLRVGMLLLTVAAPADGIVQAHVAEDGATVGYGAPLLRLERNRIP